MKRRLRWSLSFVAIGCLAILISAAWAYRTLTQRVEGEYFESDGVRIHYTDEGIGEPVVLLHGFAVNADLNWRLLGITDKLVKNYRVIMMDLRGHGLSGKPHALDQYGANMAEDVPRLLDHLQVEKAHVVGYSLGGFIALRLAATHPDRFFSASVLGAGWEPPENPAFANALLKLADALESGKSIEPVSTYLGEDRQKPGLSHSLWVRLMTGYFNDKRALVGVIRGLPDLGLTREEVQSIPIPVCSIVGDEDSLQVSAKAMEKLVPKLTATVIHGADHIQTPGRPEFSESLLAFLRTYGHSE